ncbi:MAG TPA: helix-turn-helix domain-containing protein [Rubrobacter sp.]|nr:helix-turn-helix domain-containing protein [Rubrobacter sp.]
MREAILDTTGALVAEHGLLSATMSRVAEETGIGRVALYKYFPDVESILLAWHERDVGGHLERLSLRPTHSSSTRATPANSRRSRIGASMPT